MALFSFLVVVMAVGVEKIDLTLDCEWVYTGKMRFRLALIPQKSSLQLNAMRYKEMRGTGIGKKAMAVLYFFH